jgi:hypothetical protein
MSQPRSDDVHVYALFEEAHSGGVAEDVRGYTMVFAAQAPRAKTSSVSHYDLIDPKPCEGVVLAGDKYRTSTFSAPFACQPLQ